MISAVSSISSMIERSGVVTGTQPTGIQSIASTIGGATTGVPQTSFGEIMAQFADKAVDTIKIGEATSIQGMQGKASVQQVVEAVMSAEQTLQTAIAIRDKVVAAYQEISRMAI
jgi:flagellar hook-basal body complex protein FliE